MEWKTTLKFTEAQGIDLVKSYIMANKEMFGITENDTITRVTFGVANQCTGYGYNEHYAPAFTGISIEITRKSEDTYY